MSDVRNDPKISYALIFKKTFRQKSETVFSTTALVQP